MEMGTAEIVLVLGFYNRQNFGDDLFEIAIRHIFRELSELQFQFISIDDFSLNTTDFSKIHTVIVGGGDLFNEYFASKLLSAIPNFHEETPIWALGVGIPFPSFLQTPIGTRFLQLFDRIVLRNAEDLASLNSKIGSEWVHYYPDLVFALEPPPPRPLRSPTPPPKIIGLAIAQPSAHKDPSFTNAIIELIASDQFSNFHFRFFIFNEHTKNEKENDRIFAANLCKLVQEGAPDLATRISIADPISTFGEVRKQFSMCEVVVAHRFHAHIIAMIARVKMVSIVTTRKVDLLNIFPRVIPQIVHQSSTTGTQFYLSYHELRNSVLEALNSTPKNNIFHEFYSPSNSQLSKLLLLRKKRTSACFSQTLSSEIKIQQTVSLTQNFLKNKPHSPENLKHAAEILCFQITNTPGSKYVYGTTENLKERPELMTEMVTWILSDFIEKKAINTPLTFNLDYISQLESFEGIHRSGWNFVAGVLSARNSNCGILTDLYLDRTFGWSAVALEGAGVIPYTNKWIGFVHHTLEESFGSSVKQVLDHPLFRLSLKNCICLITLSEYLATRISNYLKSEAPKIIVVKHPTSTIFEKANSAPPTRTILTAPNKPATGKIGSFQRLSSLQPLRHFQNARSKVIGVGAWYRNPLGIYMVPVPPHLKKYRVKGRKMESYFCPEVLSVSKSELVSFRLENNIFARWVVDYVRTNIIAGSKSGQTFGTSLLDKWTLLIYGTSVLNKFLRTELVFRCTRGAKSSESMVHFRKCLESVEHLEFLSDLEYDELLNESIVFLNLVDASAVNTIIECMMRGTPVIVNRHPAVEEYLGKEYPGFYDEWDDLLKRDLFSSLNVGRCERYLRDMDKSFLYSDYFMWDLERKVREVLGEK